MTEPTLIDFALTLFILNLVIGVPVVIYGMFELWAKSRKASEDAKRQLPLIKTVRRNY